MGVAAAAEQIRLEVRKAIVGQDEAVDMALVALLADGHVLLEGVPGLAKTLLVRTLAQSLDLPFGRIQFTPDLMPSDVTGSYIFNQKEMDFQLRKGPVFTSVLLADEINRTTPKTQSALLQAMEERVVTLDGQQHALPKPFLVFATQNPIDFEGTYPLPEAQQDRFLMKVVLTYPTPEDEISILRRAHEGFRSAELNSAGVQPVLNADAIAGLRAETNGVTVDEKMFAYIYGIVAATRMSRQVMVGGSPRAGLSLLSAAKALAAIRGRTFVIPDDVKSLALPVLRHRVLLRPEAEVEGIGVEAVLKGLVDAQPVPR